MSKRTYTTSGMKMVDVSRWTKFDFAKKEMHVEDGGEMWPDFVFQNRETSSGQEYVLVGEIRVIDGVKMLIKYDFEAREAAEEDMMEISYQRRQIICDTWDEEAQQLAIVRAVNNDQTALDKVISGLK